MPSRLFAALILCAAIVSFAWIGLSADDTRWRSVLVSGGGSPASNAVAHAKNIRFVRETLERLGLKDSAFDIYVSSGKEKIPDTSYYDTSRELSWERGVLDRLLGRGLLNLRYRHHGLEDVDGPARYAEVKSALKKAAKDLDDGETLLLYTTDHGQENNLNPHESYVVLWGRPDLSVKDVRESLASADDEGRVVSVMAQCYSGAYANFIYADGVSVPAAQDRCGFYATLHDREAAGCTPELNEAEYDDYTTRFFAALGGRTRMGEPGPEADYDGDGKVSFAESHAYAVGSEDTIDVPLKTSEHFLEQAGVAPSSEWSSAVAKAPAEEKATLRMLASKLDLKAGNPVSTASRIRAQLGKRIEEKTEESIALDAKLAEHEDDLRFALLERWPILDSPFDPDFARTLDEEAAEIRDFLAENERYLQWKEGLAAYHEAADEVWQLEVERAWWMRLERLAKHILRLAALPESPPNVVEFHRRLRTCEASRPGKPAQN